jgi:hypothetical protein
MSTALKGPRDLPMGTAKIKQRTVFGVGLALLAAASLGLHSADVQAQGWGWWPWSQPDPRPREPVYRQPPDQLPPGQPPPGQLPPGQMPPGQGQYPQGQSPQGQAPGPGQGQQGYGQRSAICVQLERRLVAETQGGNQGREMLPRIENDMRQLERNYQIAQQQLNRADCWDQFLFSRTLKRTPRCVQLAGDVDATRQRLADLDAQRRQIMGTRDRSYQDDIIRELARNSCGQQYITEARKRDGFRNPFSDWDEDGDSPRGSANQFGNLPFATYRTLCVRLCDGYYFPVSFSTLPNHFQRDSDACQSQCAAPAELYYHQNPGGSVEQMVSANNQQPYTGLKSAWRYRKEYVHGCSCKAAEFQPAQPGDKKAEAPAAPGTTGSTTVQRSAKQ